MATAATSAGEVRGADEIVAAARERLERQVDVVMEGIEHASYAIRSTGGPRQLAGWSDTRATEEQLAALAASGIACGPALGGFNAAA